MQKPLDEFKDETEVNYYEGYERKIIKTEDEKINTFLQKKKFPEENEK